MKLALTIHIRREAIKNNHQGNKVPKNIIGNPVPRTQAHEFSYIILEIKRNGIIFSRATNKIKGL